MHRRVVLRAALCALVALCVAAGARPVCDGCRREAMALTLPDGTTIDGSLYVPPGGGASLPAVVVLHGYLGNLGFMAVPWIADVTRLGAAALVIDRRGHGNSGGAWWPPKPGATVHLRDLAPDVHAAVDALRTRAPLIDPQRIALLGHSDGGTAAITAASADWDVAATVSLSASLAPWEYVNHVAPRNLLLLYGGADRFILADADRQLIAAATRGYLDGDGETGAVADGSARRLVRVPGYGHLDLLYAATARQEALAWLARSLGVATSPSLAPQRWPVAVAGLALLLALVWSWNGVPPAPPARETAPRRAAKLALLAGLWVGGLALAARLAPRLHWLPVQEANVVAAVLLVPGALLAAVAAATVRRRRARPVLLRQLSLGAACGAAVLVVVELLLLPVYSPALGGARFVLFTAFLALAAPAFLAIGGATAWVQRGLIARGVAVEWLLAGLAAAVATLWFARMAALPVVLLACALAFTGAFRASGRSTLATAAFGAVMYARAAADVCAFY